ncbi:MAG: hypothetical protein JSW65_05760 [Candidatus Bipolaricaulota bacterium]|nr:MAG: hypothetical protein JSW65_05760 [Candidatus Bipolaricaulota bacterium]
MSSDLVGFTRDAVASFAQIDGFEARQSITAHDMLLEATIRVGRQQRIAIQYESFRDSIATLEDTLTGAPEFVDEDFSALSLTFDGEHTWVHDRKRDVVLRKAGRVVYSPMRGASAVGELGFLRTLTQDFLLRDLGEVTIHGAPARTVGLRPKAHLRSLLLKEEYFPVRSASVAFDLATGFPVRVELRPAADSPLALVAPSSEPITIEYRNVKLGEPPEERFRFAPPADARVFVEEAVTAASLTERLPFPLPLAPLEAAGFSAAPEALLASDESHGRVYARVVFRRDPTAEGQHRPRLTLRVGNYLSANMGRRRALLSEQGSPADIPADRPRLLVRSEQMAEGKELPWGATLIELGWESRETFWFLFAEALGESELTALGRAIADAAASTTPTAQNGNPTAED